MGVPGLTIYHVKSHLQVQISCQSNIVYVHRYIDLAVDISKYLKLSGNCLCFSFRRSIALQSTFRNLLVMAKVPHFPFLSVFHQLKSVSTFWALNLNSENGIFNLQVLKMRRKVLETAFLAQILPRGYLCLLTNNIPLCMHSTLPPHVLLLYF